MTGPIYSSIGSFEYYQTMSEMRSTESDKPPTDSDIPNQPENAIPIPDRDNPENFNLLPELEDRFKEAAPFLTEMDWNSFDKSQIENFDFSKMTPEICESIFRRRGNLIPFLTSDCINWFMPFFSEEHWNQISTSQIENLDFSKMTREICESIFREKEYKIGYLNPGCINSFMPFFSEEHWNRICIPQIENFVENPWESGPQMETLDFAENPWETSNMETLDILTSTFQIENLDLSKITREIFKSIYRKREDKIGYLKPVYVKSFMPFFSEEHWNCLIKSQIENFDFSKMTREICESIFSEREDEIRHLNPDCLNSFMPFFSEKHLKAISCAQIQQLIDSNMTGAIFKIFKVEDKISQYTDNPEDINNRFRSLNKTEYGHLKWRDVINLNPANLFTLSSVLGGLNRPGIPNESINTLSPYFLEGDFEKLSPTQIQELDFSKLRSDQFHWLLPRLGDRWKEAIPYLITENHWNSIDLLQIHSLDFSKMTRRICKFIFKQRGDLISLLKSDCINSFMPFFSEEHWDCISIRQIENFDFSKMTRKICESIFKQRGDLIPLLTSDCINSFMPFFSEEHWNCISIRQIKNLDFSKMTREICESIFNEKRSCVLLLESDRLLLFIPFLPEKNLKEISPAQIKQLIDSSKMTVALFKFFQDKDQIAMLADFYLESIIPFFSEEHWNKISLSSIKKLDFSKINPEICKSIFRGRSELISSLNADTFDRLIPYFSEEHWKEITLEQMHMIDLSKMTPAIFRSIFADRIDLIVKLPSNSYISKHNIFVYAEHRDLKSYIPFFSKEHWERLSINQIASLDLSKITPQIFEWIFNSPIKDWDKEQQRWVVKGRKIEKILTVNWSQFTPYLSKEFWLELPHDQARRLNCSKINQQIFDDLFSGSRVYKMKGMGAKIGELTPYFSQGLFNQEIFDSLFRLEDIKEADKYLRLGSYQTIETERAIETFRGLSAEQIKLLSPYFSKAHWKALSDQQIMELDLSILNKETFDHIMTESRIKALGGKILDHVDKFTHYHWTNLSPEQILAYSYSPSMNQRTFDLMFPTLSSFEPKLAWNGEETLRALGGSVNRLTRYFSPAHWLALSDEQVMRLSPSEFNETMFESLFIHYSAGLNRINLLRKLTIDQLKPVSEYLKSDRIWWGLLTYETKIALGISAC